MSKTRQRPGPEKRLERLCDGVSIRAAEGDERRFHLSFSSEEPYPRWFGDEVLSHAPGAVDLKRLQEIGVVLFNHNRDYVLGRVEHPRVENMRGECDIVFDEDEKAEEIRQKVASGTLKGVSVGYRVRQWEVVENGKLSSDGRFEGPVDIAKRWTPVEISIVSVPADATVGVNRSDDDQENERRGNMEGQENRELEGQELQEQQRQEEVPAAVNGNAQAEGARHLTEQQAQEIAQRAVEAERQRSADITAICRDTGMDASEYLRSATTVDAVRQAAVSHLLQARGPVNTGVQVTRDEADKFRAAAADALYLRYSQRGGEEIVEGARDLMGMGILRMAEQSLANAGVDTRRMGNVDIIERAFLAGDGGFAAIMDQTAGKMVREEYAAAAPTYLQWARIGSLPDFKSKPTYRLGESDEFKEVPMSGELQQGSRAGQKPFHRQLKSYGKTIGISRQMLINDDIGEFTTMIASNALAAARQINRHVYELLTKNPKLEIDGKELFHADHKNVGAAGALSIATLAEMRKLMRLQKGLDGKATLNLMPETLLVPAALEVEALKLLTSLADPSQSNSGVANVLRNSMTPVVEAELDKVSETAHYALANRLATDGIGVDFLNGQNSISLKRGEPMGQLGMQWDMWIDYGLYVGDWRGITKNEGA